MGPGLRNPPNRRAGLVRRLIGKARVPMVIDADGLNLIATDPSVLSNRRSLPSCSPPTPVKWPDSAAVQPPTFKMTASTMPDLLPERYPVTWCSRVPDTIVARPDGTVFVNATGNPGMATGGMGDVLTGLIAGLITQGMEVGAAARAGVLSARTGGRPTCCRSSGPGRISGF
jgi:NAD(P)H-hydrate repair Nnr-like enzyme with NAD(P)H-hydrate dehydratase domain